MADQGITVKAENHYALQKISTPQYEFEGHLVLFNKLDELTKRIHDTSEAVVSGAETPEAKRSFPILGITSLAPGSSSRTVSSINGTNTAWNSDSFYVTPMSGYIRNYKVTVDNAPGTGASRDFILNDIMDGVNHTITLSDSETTKSNVEPWLLRKHVFFNLFTKANNSPAGHGEIKWSFDYNSIFEDAYPMFGWYDTELDNTNKQYAALGANDATTWQTESTNVEILAGVAGKFSDLTVGRHDTIAAGSSIVFAIENLTTGQSLTLTVDENPDITNSNRRGWYGSVGELDVNVGDRLVMSALRSGTPDRDQSNIAVKFTPTTEGERLVLGNNSANTHASSKRYSYARHVGNLFWDATATDVDEPATRDLTRSDLIFKGSASPGSGTYTVGMENLTTAQSITATLNSSNYQSLTVPGSLTINDGDRVVISCEAANTPDQIKLSWSYKEVDTNALASQSIETRIAYSVMASNVTDDGFDVSYHVLEKRNDYQLVVSENSDLTSPTTTVDFSNPVSYESNDHNKVFIARCTVTGLDPDTLYYYGIRSNSVIDPNLRGQLTTFPTESTSPASTDTYKIMFGSCGDITESAAKEEMAAYTTMAAEGADLLIHMGDRGYANVHDNDFPKFVDFYIKYRRNLGTRNLCTVMPTTGAVSDHEGPGDADVLNPDLMGNNLIDWTNESNDTRLGFGSIADLLPHIYKSFKEILSHYPTAQPADSGSVDGTAHSFILGQVKVIVLDTQSQRLPSNSPATALGDGTMSVNAEGGNFLTWNQRQWCKEQMLAAKETENCKLTIIAWGGGKHIGTDSFNDRYAADYEDINDYAVTANVTECLYVFGDYHAAMLDDGTGGNKFNSGSGRIANFLCAPFFDGIHEGVTGFTHSWNGQNLRVGNGSGGDKNMFGIINITNNPTKHEVDYQVIYKDTGDGTTVQDEATESLDLDVSKADTTRAINFAAATSSLANPGIGNTLNVVVNKTWLGQGEFNLTSTGGTLTKNTDYTLTEGDQFTHPNADTVNITITFLTTNTGTITLTLANATPADAGSTVGATQSTHTLTVT